MVFRRVRQIVGLTGAVTLLLLFATHPSWPTPDKLFIFLFFVFMAFGQAKEMLIRLGPFVGLLLVYESFRGIATRLNQRVEFDWMIWADRAVFGTLPTKTLQNWWWQGHAQWYDFMFYLVYMLHFVLPIALAILVWKTREKWYWRIISMYVLVSFAGFLTFVIFPAAPPWMATELGMIEPIVRVSGEVWEALGINNYEIAYSKIAPNPVAAVPSLHAAYATLLVMIVAKLYGKKWGVLAALYPLIIYVGTVYMGDHYVVDEFLGAVYAIAAYFAVIKGFAFYKKRFVKPLKLTPQPQEVT